MAVAELYYTSLFRCYSLDNFCCFKLVERICCTSRVGLEQYLPQLVRGGSSRIFLDCNYFQRRYIILHQRLSLLLLRRQLQCCVVFRRPEL